MLTNRPNRCLDVLRVMNMVANDVPITTKMRYGIHLKERTSHYLMSRILNDRSAQLITLHPRSKFCFSIFNILIVLF